MYKPLLVNQEFRFGLSQENKLFHGFSHDASVVGKSMKNESVLRYGFLSPIHVQQALCNAHCGLNLPRKK